MPVARVWKGVGRMLEEGVGLVGGLGQSCLVIACIL